MLAANFTSSSAVAERPHCRVSELWPKVEDRNWKTMFYGHYRSTFCQTVENVYVWLIGPRRPMSER